jgi:hypothetical protein
MPAISVTGVGYAASMSSQVMGNRPFVKRVLYIENDDGKTPLEAIAGL